MFHEGKAKLSQMELSGATFLFALMSISEAPKNAC